MNDQHFNKIFWFIVGIVLFGAIFTIYLLNRFQGEVAQRFGDQAIMFWLTTVVGGGIGYLLGSSAGTVSAKPKPPAPGTTTADISATITTEPEKTNISDDKTNKE